MIIAPIFDEMESAFDSGSFDSRVGSEDLAKSGVDGVIEELLPLPGLPVLNARALTHMLGGKISIPVAVIPIWMVGESRNEMSASTIKSSFQESITRPTVFSVPAPNFQRMTGRHPTFHRKFAHRKTRPEWLLLLKLL